MHRPTISLVARVSEVRPLVVKLNTMSFVSENLARINAQAALTTVASVILAGGLGDAIWVSADTIYGGVELSRLASISTR